MPIYSFRCKEHGEYDLLQSMKEEHIGKCSKCKRVYHMPGVSGDLPTTGVKIAYNRNELWSNLEKEGLMNKGTLEADLKDREESKERYLNKLDKIATKEG